MTAERPYLQSSLLLEAGFVAHGFSTRAGGCSPAPYGSWNFSTSTGDSAANVAQNYALLASRLGVERHDVKSVHQVHSARVIEATGAAGQGTSAEKADGLVSQAVGVVVGVKTADCVPVLIALPGSDGAPAMVSAVHAGWRGVEGRIVPEAIAQIEASRGPEAVPRLLVAIGPHICADCFQVGPEVAEVFPGFHRPDPSADGKFLVDLRAVLAAQIAALGVPSAQIEQVSGCTMCDPEERFFSHRKSGGVTGRMFNFIGALP